MDPRSVLKPRPPAARVQVFEESKQAGIEPSVFVYTTLMSACSKGGQWITALQLMEVR